MAKFQGFVFFFISGTDNTVHQMRQFGINFMLDVLPPAPPSDAAMAILQGGALRKREVFYPYMEARLTTLMREFTPETLSAIIRFLFVRS